MARGGGGGEAGPPGVRPQALTRGTEGCLMQEDIKSTEHKGTFVLCPETKLERSHKEWPSRRSGGGRVSISQCPEQTALDGCSGLAKTKGDTQPQAGTLGRGEGAREGLCGRRRVQTQACCRDGDRARTFKK